ncbi:MAG: UbiA family prenyltransferase [candidate division Zixibacteria bacterium]|nr:UbiA family prenyltransferase [candidate division Zixibacteria bacterium]MBU1470778.1 UbiA family prenyltransferase [candidate division Zixibacteria bacterium]MBU2625301.1 UbiA family prenyltransferase [candidate division Zixibacteria bacterium]
MKKLLDYIFFTRPVLFPPVWTILILGVRAADAREGASPFYSTGADGLDPTFILLMFLATCLYAGVYTYNQIHDIETDRKNGKLFFLAEGMISTTEALLITVVLDAVAIAGGFYISVHIGYAFAAVLILGILYSHPRTNFKGKPSHGYWANAFGHGMLPFIIGWAFLDSISLEAAFKSTPYLFGVGAIFLNTTLPDRRGDEDAGKITHGVRWGVKSTMQASVFLVILSVILAQMSGDYAYLISGLIALPFFIRAARSQKLEHITLSTKIAILALSAFACIYLPYYLALLLIGFMVARAYYKMRFDLDYPTLR